MVCVENISYEGDNKKISLYQRMTYLAFRQVIEQTPKETYLGNFALSVGYRRWFTSNW